MPESRRRRDRAGAASSGDVHPSQLAVPRLPAALLALAAALLLAGLWLGRSSHGARNHIPLPLRMASSALVSLAALLLARGGQASGLTAAGMGFGSLGDLIMAQVIPLPQHVIFGMLSFGAGHVCYIRAFRQLARQGARERNTAEQRPGIRGDGRRRARRDSSFAFLRATSRSVILGAAELAALAGWRALAYNPRSGTALNTGALLYSVLLAAMAGEAAALAAGDRRYAPVAIGGALFFASDMVLAGELFRDLDFPGIGDVVWLTYIAGQGLIIGGLGIGGETAA